MSKPFSWLDSMVDRFLCWPLPRTFGPDCGISFDGRQDDEWNKNKTWPVGTNLFTADEARAMFEHCAGDLERAFIEAQNRANTNSEQSGGWFDLSRELFGRLNHGPPLAPHEVAAYDLRIYGPGRPVPPHATGPTQGVS